MGRQISCGNMEICYPLWKHCKTKRPPKKKLTPYRNNQLKNDLPLLFSNVNPLPKVVII